MIELVFLIVVFFGSDPAGVLLPEEFATREACLAVARPIAIIAPTDNPAKAFCVAKEKKKHA